MPKGREGSKKMLLITTHVHPGQFIPWEIKRPLEQTARGKEEGVKAIGGKYNKKQQGRKRRKKSKK